MLRKLPESRPTDRRLYLSLPAPGPAAPRRHSRRQRDAYAVASDSPAGRPKARVATTRRTSRSHRGGRRHRPSCAFSGTAKPLPMLSQEHQARSVHGRAVASWTAGRRGPRVPFSPVLRRKKRRWLKTLRNASSLCICTEDGGRDGSSTVHGSSATTVGFPSPHPLRHGRPRASAVDGRPGCRMRVGGRRAPDGCRSR